MNIFSGLEQITQTDYPLAKYTWYGLGGSADFFIRPENTDQLAEIVRRCRQHDMPFRILGFGSNLLINDKGVRGAVIKLDSKDFSRTDIDGDTVTAWAGADLSKLVLECVRKGLSGLEGLTGVPGSMGGAIKMNAGGNFGDIGTVVETVLLMDNSGQLYEQSKPELVFDYRSTNITASVILKAQLKLTPANTDQILRTVKEIWIYKKNNQPLNTKNSGCIFKNPRGVSAGALIDRAGLKGLQVGDVKVSDKHANFIIAGKTSTSRDIKRLIEAVRQRVNEQFDVDLELELEIWD